NPRVVIPARAAVVRLRASGRLKVANKGPRGASSHSGSGHRRPRCARRATSHAAGDPSDVDGRPGRGTPDRSVQERGGGGQDPEGNRRACSHVLPGKMVESGVEVGTWRLGNGTRAS